MIPYDDLVVALATWRAKQGLPVAATFSATGAALVPPPPPAPPVVAKSGRSGPPAAPPSRTTAPMGAAAFVNATPPPMATIETVDVEDGSLIEESHYQNEGDDFAVGFGAAAPADPGHAPVEDEATAIGLAPHAEHSRPSEVGLDTEDDPDASLPPPPPPRGRNEDW